jgi:phosphomannomutase
MAYALDSLRANLCYEPINLKFGTSGRRGEVKNLTQLEIYINLLAELRYLQTLPLTQGGVVPGDEIYYAYDLRPSSSRYDAAYLGRGEICQAAERAIRDAGMCPVNLGQIPTPALTHYALLQSKASVMITGSHIPFDRNGYKLNTSKGELLKEHEEPIQGAVDVVREEIYSQAYLECSFNEAGLLKNGHREILPENNAGAQAYMDRYVRFFGAGALDGVCVLFYQHSAVGRDMVPEILERLGAEVIRTGRSETFVPIDTENIDAAQLQAIQNLADEACASQKRIDAVVSTDGDSDRPLVLAVDPATGKLRFLGGDLVGMLVAEFLEPDAVVVPISSNDAVDRGKLAFVLEPKTKIGSPHVIAGMERAARKGRQAICGWEANGGFLVGSDLKRGAAVLSKLPTRDAVLPILCLLVAARERGKTLIELFNELPARFSRAALLRPFPFALGQQIVRYFSPSDPMLTEVAFPPERLPDPELEAIREELARFFNPEGGFGSIVRLNYTDGVRIWFGNGDVAHLRPSGNADEFRVYAVADTQARADEIAAQAVLNPGGIVLRMRGLAETVAAESGVVER